jgi:hypothetical protein
VSLTGSTFQWLTISAAIVVTIAIVVGWNHVRGPRPVRLASRIGMLAAGYLIAAVAVLVSVNISYGGLIATWGDLFANLNPPAGNWHPHYRHGHGHRPGPGTPGQFGGPHQLPPPVEAAGQQSAPPGQVVNPSSSATEG